MAMSGRDHEEQASMPKAVTEQEAKQALSAVFAACVATQIRAGKSEEEAMRICHASIEKQLTDKLKAQQAQMPVKPKGSKMRKAAGIMLVIFGIVLATMPLSVAHNIAWVTTSTIEEYGSAIRGMSDWVTFAVVGILILIVGGGISALRAKAYRWALVAAIVSIVAMAYISLLLALVGIIPLVFIVKRRGQFQGRAASG